MREDGGMKIQPKDEFEKGVIETTLKEGGTWDNISWYINEYRAMKKNDDNQSAEEYMRREYPITLMDGFLDTGSSYFDLNVIKGLRTYIESVIKVHNRKVYQFGLLREPGGKMRFVEASPLNRLWVWAAPIKGWENRYFIFADCGKGKADSDFDVFYVIDRVSRETVAMSYGRLGAENQAPLMMAAGEWYGNAWISWDRTGCGEDRLKYFLDDRYPNLYSRRKVDNVYIEPDFLGIEWSDPIKYAALGYLKTLWQKDQWRIWDLEAYEEAKTFGYPENGKSPCAGEGFHDDRIMALAGLAYLEPNLPAPIEIDPPEYGKEVRTGPEILARIRNQMEGVPADLRGGGNWD